MSKKWTGLFEDSAHFPALGLCPQKRTSLSSARPAPPSREIEAAHAARLIGGCSRRGSPAFIIEVRTGPTSVCLTTTATAIVPCGSDRGLGKAVGMLFLAARSSKASNPDGGGCSAAAGRLAVGCFTLIIS